MTLQFEQRTRRARCQPRVFRQAVLGLFPEIGRDDKLIKRAPGRQRQQQPMHRRQQQDPDRSQKTAPPQTQPAKDNRRQITGNDGGRKKCDKNGIGPTVGQPNHASAVRDLKR